MTLSDSNLPERPLLAAAAAGVRPRDSSGGAGGPKSVTVSHGVTKSVTERHTGGVTILTVSHGRALPDLRIPTAVATLPTRIRCFGPSLDMLSAGSS